MQVGAPGSKSLLYKGPIDCAVKVLRTQGIRGLTRGAPATIIRETPGCGLYFTFYEVPKAWLERRWGLTEQASSILAGGLSGALSWVFVYPFDVIKSIQQVSGVWIGTRCLHVPPPAPRPLAQSRPDP